MSQNRLVLEGLAELRDFLGHLPSALRDEGAESVEAATAHSAASLIQSYPPGPTGRLRAGVKAAVVRSEFGVVGTVKSTAPEAHLWEFGTAVRATRQGWNRGRSPSHHAEGLIPIAVRNRKTMHGQLVNLVRKAGFEVSGVL